MIIINNSGAHCTTETMEFVKSRLGSSEVAEIHLVNRQGDIVAKIVNIGAPSGEETRLSIGSSSGDARS